MDTKELAKALQYDRQQYEKGYEDGVREFANKLVEHYFYDLERLAIFEEDIIHFVDKIFKDRDEQCDELKKEIERLNKIIEEYEDREMFSEANDYC